ncbi:rod-binding protein [Litorivicinus sp.]|nr:rod-binding protein [Litorivicinus sp.]MDB9862126.1 rod-binding protein [Litorivicinus sp.]
MSLVEGPATAFDFAALGELKAQAARDGSDDAAIKKAAQQFESMFLQMMLKSMRAAIPDGGLLESKATKTFEQMYDQQIVMAMSEKSTTGVAQMIESFIRRTQAEPEDGSKQPFLLDQKSKAALNLNGKSDFLPISEGITKDFLLNHNQFLRKEEK